MRSARSRTSKKVEPNRGSMRRGSKETASLKTSTTKTSEKTPPGKSQGKSARPAKAASTKRATANTTAAKKPTAKSAAAKAKPAQAKPAHAARKPSAPVKASSNATAKARSTQAKPAASKPTAKPTSKRPAKPSAKPLSKSSSKATARPAALHKASAAQKSGPATAVAPVTAAKAARIRPSRAAARPLAIDPKAVAAQAQSATAKAAAAKSPDRTKSSKKQKPPAKTMRVPAPMTDILIKRDLPDVRRVASAALLADTGRGISPPAPHGRTKEPERGGEPPVDASLIASSLASDIHPKIEDNYDYSVLEELAASKWCPSPTRMISTGCGGGEPAVFFAKRGFNVVGVDSDRTAVGLARERAWLAGVEIDFMVGDQFETPNLLPAESFGLAIDRGGFYRLADDRDRQRYLSNIRRLLFQGGVCYLSAGFFPLPEGVEKPKGSKKAPPKILLVREGGMIVNEIRQAGFEMVHRVLRPTNDSKK